MAAEVASTSGLTTEAFDFELPREAIAARPAVPRDSARMLVVDGGLGDACVRDLPDLLRPTDVLVLNDTAVVPARLTGRRGAARIQATLHMRVSAVSWWAYRMSSGKSLSGRGSTWPLPTCTSLGLMRITRMSRRRSSARQHWLIPLSANLEAA